MPSSEVDSLKQERERLRIDHAAGASGLSVVRAISDATDRAIASIWARVGGSDDCALVAIGGFGRRELSPSSDVDLVILQRRHREVPAAAKALAYELWDGGLELGYAVRTPKETLRLSKDRIDTATAFLDARFLAGDASLFEECFDQLVSWAGKATDKFMARLRDATDARRTARGDAGAELEPDVKEGRGGLRDLATIGWIRRLSGPGIQGFTEAESAAADFLHRVRNQLHYMSGRRTDVLLMQDQPRVAAALIVERGEVAAEDRLMRALYEHARAVGFTVDSLLAYDAGGPRRPNRTDVFADAIDLSEPVWNDRARETFLSVLRAGGKGRRDLEQMDHAGLLVAALPEWAGIRCLPQRNIYHQSAVDVHSFDVVGALVELFDRGKDLVRQVADDASADRDLLLVAGLLHDIGKGEGEDHAIRGEELARTALQRMGFADEADEVVLFLVRHHLMLSEAATRRDIGDERLIVELAEKAGSQRRLRMLYLLTVADGIATGPAAWGPWKATLVNRLFTRMTHALELEGLVGGDAALEAASIIDRLRKALDAHPSPEVDAHLENMPRAWLMGQTFDALVHQSRLMLGPLEPDELKLDAVAQSEAGIWVATVVARDRPGLFSKISGSLALHGLNVVGADVYTRSDGVAVEIFRLEALGDEVQRFERVVSDARKALRGRLSLDVHLSEKRRDYALRPAKGKQEPPRIVVDNRSSDFHTVIEVHATDRVGLLYTITRALADLELDIQTAKIATYAEDVVDVFYVRDLEGQKVTDREHVAEIERTILHRLAAEA